MLKKSIFAFVGALMLAGSSAAMADNALDTRMDVYPGYTAYQSNGANAFASARRPADRTVRYPRASFSASEMSLFDRIDPHGF